MGTLRPMEDFLEEVIPVSSLRKKKQETESIAMGQYLGLSGHFIQGKGQEQRHRNVEQYRVFREPRYITTGSQECISCQGLDSKATCWSCDELEIFTLLAMGNCICWDPQEELDGTCKDEIEESKRTICRVKEELMRLGKAPWI